jgi:hypothetical protein
MELLQNREDLKFIETGIYLWVIHADKVPPHIGISSNGLFYSLKANGKDEHLNVSRILHILDKKNIATLFYAIDPAALKHSVSGVYSIFESTVPGEVTCLSPLKEIFSAHEVYLLRDLLRILHQRGTVTSTFGWQLPESFQGIPEYTVDDIHQRLQYLEDGK